MAQGESIRPGVDRLLPLFTFTDPSTAVEVADALSRAGFGHIEVAFRSVQAAEAIAAIRAAVEIRVVAGTLLTLENVDAARQAGAHAGVSPHWDEEILSHAQSVGFDFAPGVATPTEVFHALQAGVTTIKVFPAATLGGPGYLRALSAVYPSARFIPSGGIRSGDVPDYLALDTVSLVSGSWLPAPAVAGGVDEAWKAQAQSLATQAGRD